MGGNTFLPQKAGITHFLPLSVTDTMNNKNYGECRVYTTL